MPTNVLSLALAVRWQGHRIVLGGDVDNGNRSPHSGWKGILAHAERTGLGVLLEEVDLVKVAHHGSARSFHTLTWQRHRKPDGSTAAVISPFTRSALPAPQVLRDLTSHCGRLGMTRCDPTVEGRAEEAGWKKDAGRPPETLAPCVAAVFSGGGNVELFAGELGALFTRPAAELWTSRDAR